MKRIVLIAALLASAPVHAQLSQFQFDQLQDQLDDVQDAVRRQNELTAMTPEERAADRAATAYAYAHLHRHADERPDCLFHKLFGVSCWN